MIEESLSSDSCIDQSLSKKVQRYFSEKDEQKDLVSSQKSIYQRRDKTLTCQLEVAENTTMVKQILRNQVLSREQQLQASNRTNQLQLDQRQHQISL